MYKLTSSKTVDLTKEVAEQFHKMEASPTERDLDLNWVKALREKAEAGHLITFSWATAQSESKKFRVNGNHSSTMLCELNGAFPKGLKAHIDEYKVESEEDLALLFRQFDSRRSSRSDKDIASAHQGLYDDLRNVPKGVAKLGAEGIYWYKSNVVKINVSRNEEKYTVFAESGTHPFLQWLSGIIDCKTVELKYIPIIAAAYATFTINEEEAKKFWLEVSRGGDLYADNAPTTVLDNWLKKLQTEKTLKRNLSALNIYQGCVWAWNNYRRQLNIKDIKFDTKKGLFAVNE